MASRIAKRPDQPGEEALRASERRYRDLFENAYDMLFTYDLKGNFTSLNGAGERLSGYSRHEAIEMNIADVFAPEYRGVARKALQQRLLSQSESPYELPLVRKDRRRVPVEISTRLIVEHGRPIGVEAIARDITERKQLEEQLRHAQRLEAVGRLAAGVVQQFNNVVGVIRGNAELMLDEPALAHSGLRSRAEEILSVSDRAASLIRQLMAFSRQQVLQPRVLDMNAVVTETSEMLRRLIGEDIQLVTILAPDLGKVKADPGQLDQVLVNLALNARDAMPKGGRLTIETDNSDSDKAYLRQNPGSVEGRYVTLTVTDTGDGMDRETQSRVFEPFFTTKGPGKAAGLGLSTVYGIVRQSGGQIWVNSEPGKGAQFKIYLPRVEAREATPIRAAQAGPLPKTVLLVEDTEMFRVLARTFLERLGCKILEASEPAEAIRLAARSKPSIDLLLTDVVMPGMSGFELARRLCESRPAMKVLYMSAHAREGLERHGAPSSRLAFLGKPFTRESLEQKVREVLAESSEPRP